MFDVEDPNLDSLRIEITKSDTVYLYYKQYPKDSEKFPKNRSYLVFYFNNELINEKVLQEYFSLIKQPEKIALGQFFNKRGSQKKRKVVYYAIVRFDQPYEIDKIGFQVKVNEYLENVKNRKLLVDFNPLKDDATNIYDEEDGYGEDEVDEDGFVTVTANNTTKNRFVSSKYKGLAFDVIKEKDEDSIDEEIKRKKRKKKQSSKGMFKNKNELEASEEEDNELEEVYGKTNKGFWNIQNYEKQKRGKYTLNLIPIYIILKSCL